MSAQERSGWRDMRLSLRHRKWGFNCPSVDLDFLMVEYNKGVPVALVEYKHFRAAAPNLLHPSYQALLKLADAANLPFLIAVYWPGAWAFRVSPVNAKARGVFAPDETLSERAFVRRLYEIRRLAVEDATIAVLNDVTPDTVGFLGLVESQGGASGPT